MVNRMMAIVFEKGQVFQQISYQQHTISNFEQIKEMLIVRITAQYVCSLKLVRNRI
jgi:hypothetical protein